MNLKQRYVLKIVKEFFLIINFPFQTEFKQLMQEIQSTYKNLPPENITTKGAPIIAEFLADKVLYRAVILEIQNGQYLVEYVDFGNRSKVQKVWPIDVRFMSLPKHAIHCSLFGIKPNGETWPPANQFGSYFDKEYFDCTFIVKAVEEYGKYWVDLRSDGKAITENLVESNLAVYQEPTKFELELSYLPGQQLRVTLTNFITLSDFSVELEPGVFINCSMHNLETATETFENVLKQWVGYPLIMYVDDLVGQKFEVTFYDGNGYKLEILKPDEGAYDSVDPLCPAPVFENLLHGFVCYSNDTSVFVQPSKYMHYVEVLLHRLFDTYNESVLENPIVPEEDVIYAARFSDGNWYRGKVISVDEKNVTVKFIDYGNVETVTIEDLRELTPEFQELHMLAVEVIIFHFTFLILIQLFFLNLFIFLKLIYLSYIYSSNLQILKGFHIRVKYV